MRQSAHRRAKLDQNDFTGIFIGFTATNHNIGYIDSTSGIVKLSPHAVFDECWFHQSWQPPAAQLLYDLGTQLVGSRASSMFPDDPQITLFHNIDTTTQPLAVASPPDTHQPVPPSSITDRSNSAHPHTTTHINTHMTTHINTLHAVHLASLLHVPLNPDMMAVDHYDITHCKVYFSPHCFGHAFEEEFDYRALPPLSILLPASSSNASTDALSSLTYHPGCRLPNYLVGDLAS